MSVLTELLYAACLAAFAFPWFVGFACLMERWADGCPKCSKGRLCSDCLAASEAIRPGGGSA